MSDIKKCTAGRNARGQWHIACDEPAMGSLGILQNMRYTDRMSSPHGRHYDWAAVHIRDSGGTSWTTNLMGAYTTVAGIPKQPGS